MSQRPLDIINQSLNNTIIVALKNNVEIRGILLGYDQHLNLVLKDADEIVDGKIEKSIGIAVIRGDNIIYISPAEV